MKHDDIDDLLAHGLRDYNAPPAVPREEMWRRISEARFEARGGAVAEAGGEHTASSVRSIQAGSKRVRWTWTTVGIAASLLLAAGIGIGRWIERRPGTTPAVASTTRVVRPTGTDTSAARPAQAEPQQVVAAVHDAAVHDAAAHDAGAPSARSRNHATQPGGSSVASSQLSGAERGTPSRSATTANNLAYRLVVLQHLAGSEAMITAFRSSARTGHVDPQIGRWSRDLLSTTRLLEASQATDDPVMKRLLGDLDLVITQIVQYSARDSVDAEELNLIEQSINERGVITKLRGTLPGRTSPAGS